MKFTLTPTDASEEAWAHVLAKPTWSRRKLPVSVGLAEDSKVRSSPSVVPINIQLDVIPHLRLRLWALLVSVLLIAFFILAAKSDLLRDVGPSPGGGARRPFSLARTQAAWWFFIILGTFLLIGIVTGNYLSSITGSVLVLLGISAGTVVGGAAVDASQQKPEFQARQAAAQVILTSQAVQADATVQAADKAHAAQTNVVAKTAQAVQAAKTAQAAAPGNPAAAQAVQAAQTAHATEAAQAAQTAAAVAAANVTLEEKQSQLRAARNESENFLLDILSDADGVSFHRFQNAAWTVVLGIIFGWLVYRDLAMPQFDSTLLALMGISAGTYLGMKIPEPKVPTT